MIKKVFSYQNYISVHTDYLRKVWSHSIDGRSLCSYINKRWLRSSQDHHCIDFEMKEGGKLPRYSEENDIW